MMPIFSGYGRHPELQEDVQPTQTCSTLSISVCYCVFGACLNRPARRWSCPPPGDTIQPACSVPSTGVFRLLT